MAADGGEGVKFGPRPINDGWRPLHPDMPREQEELYLERLRAMTPAEKFTEISRLTRLETERIELRIRALRPLASDAQVALHRFAIQYGRSLAMEVYGWDPFRRGW